MFLTIKTRKSKYRCVMNIVSFVRKPVVRSRSDTGFRHAIYKFKRQNILVQMLNLKTALFCLLEFDRCYTRVQIFGYRGKEQAMYFVKNQSIFKLNCIAVQCSVLPQKRNEQMDKQSYLRIFNIGMDIAILFVKTS